MAIDLKRADDAARVRLASTPRALSARLLPDDGRLQIELSDGIALLVPPKALEGLQDATADDLAHVEISPSGFGLHFPTVDADVYVPGLLEGRTGSARFMAAALGARGGASRSDAKAEAARRNGAKGGRPRKHASA